MHLKAVAVLAGLLLVLMLLQSPEPEETSTENTLSRDTATASAGLSIPVPEPEPVQLMPGPPARQLAAGLERSPGKEPSYTTEVRSGDNLSVLFDRAGLTPRDVYQVSNSGDKAAILEDLHPGYTLAFNITEDKRLQALEVIISPQERYVFTRNEQAGYDIEHILRKPEIRQRFKSATIRDSLFLSARRGGISAPLTLELADIFGGVIDFILDVREGDTFNVLYEEKYLDGEFIGNGAILAARFNNQDRTFTALRYVDDQGDIDYYNPRGESMRKAFLRNPVDFTRISSGFSLSRRHPILNTIRAHKGTDYAAPNGTPVVATADGRVTWVARNGSFGKLVVIRHSGRFETKYAHLSNYARGIGKGTRVEQGQVIGYVGATGSATGPHLHYEFLMDGVHRNSRTIHDKLPKAESIPDAEMAQFREQTQALMARLEPYTDQPALARNETGDDEDEEVQ